ncbi:tol-pal system YbgF family protein [Balneola sp. MJW-20]|uniref:tetratricopeptide repeat protein n=1 Tax=Gracilimonas aurantiaca TaxID=3234185 RepID=UPI003466BCD6
MSKRRLSKEELESDPLIENYTKAVNYYQTHKPTILAAVIGIVVVVGSLIGYNYYSEQQELEAQNLLATAESYYNQGDYDKALNGDSFELTYGFAQIANDYSGTHAGNLATYYAAVSAYRLGNVEEAISFFNNFEVPRGILGVGPLTFHAKLLDENEQNELSSTMYLKAAEWDVNDNTTPYNLLKAAQASYEAGNYDDASDIATRVIREYPQSPEIADAQKLLGMLAAL